MVRDPLPVHGCPIEARSLRAVVAGGDGRLKFRSAGLPGVIEPSEAGWRVTIASASVAEDPILANAIVRASGGLIDMQRARRIAKNAGMRATRRIPEMPGAG